MHCRVACASHGGPIAITRAERQVVVVTGASMKPKIAIYSAAGQALASVEWDHGSIVGLGWTGDEKLVIVEATGEVGSPCFSFRQTPEAGSICL